MPASMYSTRNPVHHQHKENTMPSTTTKKHRLPAAVALSSALVVGGTSPALAIDGTPTQPPGFDFVTTLVGWALYIAAFVLFIYFIIGIVTAAKARRSGDQEITAPLWPLLGGAALTVVGVVWQNVVGI